MNWTKEIPTIDGWYWVKGEWTSWIEEVKDSSLYSNIFEEWQNIDKNDDLEFYGPLEEPK